MLLFPETVRWKSFLFLVFNCDSSADIFPPPHLSYVNARRVKSLIIYAESFKMLFLFALLKTRLPVVCNSNIHWKSVKGEKKNKMMWYVPFSPRKGVPCSIFGIFGKLHEAFPDDCPRTSAVQVSTSAAASH